MSVLLGSNAGNRAPKNWSRKNYLFSTNKKKKKYPTTVLTAGPRSTCWGMRRKVSGLHNYADIGY